jgi:prepilin signal peptidase PulO-like enzyme (type II secretory pathway)
MKVPNRLSLPTILLGWLASLFVQFGVLPSAGGGFLASFAVSLLAGIMLIPVQGAGWIGAGCVKMHAGLGAWVGCALGLWPAVLMIGAATLMGTICTIVFSGIDHARKRRKPGYKPGILMFPIQATLSLGAIICIVGAGLLGWV